MASPTEASLVSKLKTSDSIGIYALISDYLRPFSDIKSCQNDQTLIRTLAKRFVPFINCSISILPKRISEVLNSNELLISELFQVYILCLDCLEAVCSQLVSKPLTIHNLRLRLIRCYVSCNRFDEAEAEGFKLLKSLHEVKSKGEQEKILPEIDKGGVVDKELSSLVVDIVVTLVKCASMASSVKDDGYFRRVLHLMDEVRLWLRGLDSNSYEKFHKALAYHLGNCALNFLEKISFSDKNLVITLCQTALIEFAKPSLKDQLFKIAHKMCSILFTLDENKLLYIMDILDCFARENKVEERHDGVEFIELVYYCVIKCQNANASFCHTFATYLNKTAEHYKQFMKPLNSILRLYAAGLLLVSCKLKSGVEGLVFSGTTKFECFLGTLLENKKILQSSPPLHGSFHICSRSSCMPTSVEDQQFDGPTCTQSASDCEAVMTYQSFYVEALNFLCLPLVKSVNSERKQLLTEKIDASTMTMLSTVEDAFHALCQFILYNPRFTVEKDDDGFAEKSKTMPCFTLAVFTLSIRTNRKLQESTQLIKHVIASKWIDTEGLKYIINCLFNSALFLYQNKQPEEASKVLNLCCKVSWLCIKCHCGNLSEGALKEFVMDAYTRSALLLDFLYETNNLKIRKKLIETLKNWSSVSDLYVKIPAPIPVVKKWVKIECRRDEVYSPSLYSILSSSTELSKQNIGTILEQELTAYEEMSDKYPEFCQKMQLKITNILLQKIYITPISCFQKAHTLVRKGKALRFCGIDGLRDCIHCLSEAIIIMKEIPGEMCSKAIPIYHQLCVAYCLRALCTQEAEPCSEQIFEDVKAALDLWLDISSMDCFEEGGCSALSDSIMILLYNIIDLLHLKGFMELFNDAYRLLIRIFKLKSISTEKWLTLLWESRRFSHALCVSPVDEAFILNSLDEFSGLSNVNFWMHNLKGNQSSLIGFQQNFSFLLASSHRSSCDHGSSFQVEITVDEVQKAALKLISNEPAPSHCTFLAGYLYSDLCQRLVANGKLIEALSFAKEAHRLHAKLFKVKFRRNFQKNNEENIVEVDFLKNLMDGVDKIQVGKSVVREVFLFDYISWDSKDNYLSPWKIMQCYLESTFQIGVIYEIIGDAIEAETYIQWGKAISCSLQLPLFIVAFSSLLGKLYLRKRLWDLAEKELQCAQQILNDNSMPFCCSKCKLILEVTLHGYLGDLCQSKFNACEEGVSEETAKNWYTSALNKLTLSDWKNPLSCPEDNGYATATDAKCAAGKTCTCSIMNEAGEDVTKSTEVGPVIMIERKQSRRSKNSAKVILKEPTIVVENKPRLTRSRYRSIQNQHANISRKLEVNENEEGNQTTDQFDMISRRESISKEIGCSISSRCAISCILSKIKCWNYLPSEVVKSGLLNDFIILKWEFVRRKLSMKLLTRVVSCYAYPGQIEEAQKILLKSMSLLFVRNPFCHRFSSIPLDSFLQLVAKEIPGDVFAIERAEIVYSICWYSLKFYHSKFTRNIFCNLSNIKFEDIVSWLMVAFVLSREVPIVFQKVSKLLAMMYTVSSVSEQFSIPSYSKVFDENYWSSYFHQASIGTHLTFQFLSHLTGRCKGPYVTGSSFINEVTFDSLRVAPDSTVDLAESVKKFFAGLPLTTIIGISLLEPEYTCLLQELLPHPRCVKAWMLVSRLNFKTEPVVMLLPLDSVLQDEGDVRTGSDVFQIFQNPSKVWHCPWGFTMVDDIAPAFKTILKENYLQTVARFENTMENRISWWKQRTNLDHCLDKFLRNLEDLWFGSWNCLLLGEWLNNKKFDLVLKNLVNDLRSKCKLNVNEGILKIVLGGSKYISEGKTLISQLCSKKDCYIAKGGYCAGPMGGIFLNSANKLVSSEIAFELLNEALNVLEVDDFVNREPVILVLDSEVQMLPWENFPILRNQEIYRMPSVSSISAVLDNGNNHKEQVGRNLMPFPNIDPLDAFYLINPDGDLVGTQLEFENYFRDQNLEGKAGSKPTVEELTYALENHDLFIYFGHGSGEQYLPSHKIQKLPQCGATLLMGCCSGSLTSHGSYAPQGVALSYLLAGSPSIVANLWEVTESDIHRFGKAMFNAWLKERPKVATQCLQCNLELEEFEAINLKGGKGRAKKKVPKKKSRELFESESPKNKCSHRPKIGAFMGQARNVCKLPFLIGASPICYGVPTGIWKKKDI
ncbi:separase-like isoform X2 [Vicia villosa]|uniref:separase-like isoform X2 n=1 Tax=Vicia villosa TaxID=3911 RepID=UPI00273B5FE6|nr:separase-like isoform X2 [Vicia villosa]